MENFVRKIEETHFEVPNPGNTLESLPSLEDYRIYPNWASIFH